MPVRTSWTADDDEAQSQSLPGSDSPNDAPEIQAPSASSPVKPYTPPDSAVSNKTQSPPPDEKPDPTQDAQPPRTFAQMEAEGQARPPASEAEPAPAPESAPVIQTLLTPPAPLDATPSATAPASPSVPSAPSVGGFDMVNTPPITEYAPQLGGSAPTTAPASTPVSQGVDLAPSGSTITEYAPNFGVPDAPPSAGAPPAPAPSPAAPSPTPPPASADSILPLLTGKANGTDTSPLQDATTKATLDALQNPNPYNADEVKREFSDLGAGIDADYDTRQRNLSDDFARRGLFGSVGKDFASGRAADTEVGRRTAKTQLGNALATAQAQSAAGARSNAISQGQAGVNASNGNQLNWLQSLMGYGNDAFNHDLQTATFQQNQNESEQDYLLRLLQAGYGV